MATDVTEVTSSIDFRRLVADAEAAGFNPLTALRAGAAAGYGVTRQSVTYDPLSGSGAAGSFTSPVEAQGGDTRPVRSDSGGFTSAPVSELPADSDWFGPAMSVTGRNSRFEAESEYNIAMAQLRMRQGRLASEAAQAGGLFSPISYTGAPGVVGVPAKSGKLVKDKSGQGFQPAQIYEDDKIPAVITGDTTHWVLPGVSWEERGGTTRGNEWETIYGDDTPGSFVLSTLKFFDDVGHNVRRAWDANMPTLPKTLDWLETLETTEAELPSPLSYPPISEW